MIFPLVQDCAEVLAAMPREHPRHRILKLLDEAIRRDVHFIDRHPTTFFQCMWNTCWWYDCPEAAGHYLEPDRGWRDSPPWDQAGPKICNLLETWQQIRRESNTSFIWLRSLRPPPVHLGTAQLAELRGQKDAISSVAWSPDRRWIVSGSYDKTLRIWDAENGGVRRNPYLIA